MLRKISTLLLSTLVAGVIIVFLLSRVWDELLTTLHEADPRYLLAATLICLLAWYMRGVRYRYILMRLSVCVSTIFSTACIFVSQTANLIIPARLGDLIRLLILRHEKETTYTVGFSSLIVERVFDIITIALIGAIALPFVVGQTPWFSLLIGLVLIAGLLFFLVLFISGRFTSENRILAKIFEIMTQIRLVSLTPPALVYLLFSSVIIWIIDCLVCVMVAMMFGETVPIMVIVLAIVIGNLVKAVPITPGGIGTYELALAMTFELAGVAPGIAVLIAIVDHLIKNLVTLGGGALSVYYFGDWTLSLLKRAFSGDIRGELRDRD
ncbi:lysylphosphatidylglycerol synthase transmembrane domain-containing protein [Methanocalculus sp.]|uniref:lysylphosphatidylglycerol synthase transmembrane domain-containing protein n=1 Tax=Methanocalculus sp. TaxID=2004547 RepID=UPI00271DAB0A|nr:lysylphosphatidylglycerol synthase transmembrane domain-containing protein [Methanocalculus sp.]MDO8841171.1 lysylphosphatidylglycerol synthase transmembrane domain-containing protein [Methanocalculus sp.]